MTHFSDFVLRCLKQQNIFCQTVRDPGRDPMKAIKPVTPDTITPGSDAIHARNRTGTSKSEIRSKGCVKNARSLNGPWKLKSLWTFGKFKQNEVPSWRKPNGFNQNKTIKWKWSWKVCLLERIAGCVESFVGFFYSRNHETRIKLPGGYPTRLFFNRPKRDVTFDVFIHLVLAIKRVVRP